MKDGSTEGETPMHAPRHSSPIPGHPPSADWIAAKPARWPRTDRRRGSPTSTAFAGVVACVLTALSSAAADPRPSWECLPEETAVMVRLPQPREFVEALRSRTRFGAVVLGERRLERMGKAMFGRLRLDGADDTAERWQEPLAKYGLEPSDLEAPFAGDLGFGVVLVRRANDRPPLQMMLTWLEPGEEAAERLLAAGKRMLEDRQQAENVAPRRVDLEMAGHDVIWIAEPEMGLDLGDLDLEDADATADAEAVRKRIAAAKPVQTGLIHSFVTRVGGRLLVGQTLPSGRIVARAAAVADRNWDDESGAEEAKAVFERFLVAHAAAGPAPMAEILSLPGSRATLPEGLPLVDIIVDPRVFLNAIGGDDAEVARRLEAVGLDGVGPVTWRQSFDEGVFRNGIFVSMPAPRRGLMRILDEACDPCEAPSFVTGEATDLTQVSLDLGRGYRTIREVMVAAGGEEAANMFTAAEMQAQGWLGVELPKLLSSLGSRHWLIAYPSKVADAIAAGRRGGGAMTNLDAANRGAIAWQVTDEASLLKILQRLAPLAGGELTDEQGFRGIRIPNGPAVFVGMNHLVVGVGAESLEKTIAGIRTPPAGPASLREGEAMRRAAALLPLDPARMFSVGDASVTGGLLGNLREILANTEPDDVQPEYRDLLAGIKEALPTAAEMEGMFGVSVSTLRATDAGLAFRSAWDMPAP